MLGARDPCLDPYSRPRLHLTASSLTPGMFGVDVATSENAEVALGWVMGVPSRPDCVTAVRGSISSAFLIQWIPQRVSVHRRRFSSRPSRRHHRKEGQLGSFSEHPLEPWAPEGQVDPLTSSIPSRPPTDSRRPLTWKP